MNEKLKLEAIEVCKNILKALHEKNFDKVMSFVDESEIDDLDEYLEEFVQGNLELNDLDRIDKFDNSCLDELDDDFCILHFLDYDDETGFYLEYEMTSDGEPTDLLLQLKFEYEGDGLRKIFENVEPQ